MKFVLTKEHLYHWPVEINVPDPDQPGKFQTQTFNMQFRAMPLDESRKLTAEINALPEAEQEERQNEHMLRVCRGWDENVVDDEGEPIAFSEEQLKEAMQSTWFRIGLYRSYQKSLVGDEVRLGN